MSATAPVLAAAHGTSPSTYIIMGREVRLPVEVRDANAVMAYYLVSARAAQVLAEPAGLEVAEVFPGRALCTIGTMKYRDNDLGQYDEIAITFYVREPGQRSLPLIGTLLDFGRGRVGAYIWQLPVNGEFTCAAGNGIWGFPKSVCDIRIDVTDGRQTTEWHADGQHVLTQELVLPTSASVRTANAVSYAVRDGVRYKTPTEMRVEGVGAKFFGGATLTLGPHPIADRLRALGLPKRALLVTHVPKWSGKFHAAERTTVGHR
jgi:hypothetical protein